MGAGTAPRWTLSALCGIRRGLHGRAGQRERARARLALALRLLLRLRLGRGRLLLGADARLVLVCAEPSEPVAAPVVTSWKTISSAARPPSVIAIWCMSAVRVVR